MLLIYGVRYHKGYYIDTILEILGQPYQNRVFVTWDIYRLIQSLHIAVIFNRTNLYSATSERQARIYLWPLLRPSLVQMFTQRNFRIMGLAKIKIIVVNREKQRQIVTPGGFRERAVKIVSLLFIGQHSLNFRHSGQATPYIQITSLSKVVQF